MFFSRCLRFEVLSILARRDESYHLLFIGPFKILECVGRVAYKVALPPKMSRVYNIFHISILRKCAYNLKREIDFKVIEVNGNRTCSEGPVLILDRELKRLRNKEILLVKIQ